MIPTRFAPYLVGLLVSGMMSCLVSGLATWRALGIVDGFAGLWLASWLFAWAVACPTLLVVSPLARHLVAALTRPDRG